MKRKRNPAETRQRILEAAFEAVHRHGFQAVGLNDILQAAGVTKGAMYHHFPNKMALGYAIADEMLTAYVDQWWLAPFENDNDPVPVLKEMIESRLRNLSREMIGLGCPLNNLAQEMSAVDEGFRQRIEGIYRYWRKGLAKALRAGQQYGTVLGEVDTERTATVLVAAIEGAMGLGKATQDRELIADCVKGLLIQIDRLRP